MCVCVCVSVSVRVCLIDLVEDWELESELAVGEVALLLGGPGGLAAELVARKADQVEAVLAVRFVPREKNGGRIAERERESTCV